MHQRSTEFEMELIAEDDVATLQRKYRTMDANYRLYQQYEQFHENTQKTKIKSTLLKEKRNLMDDLNVAASKHNQRMDDQTIKRLQNLLIDHAVIKDKVILKKGYDQDLENQINAIQKKIIETHLEHKATDIRYHERIQLTQKNIIKLENRLEVQVNRFSCMLKENIELRKEIQLLMKERERFNKDWSKFFNNLWLNNKFMKDLIEQTFLIYNDRDEFCRKIEVLTHKARVDIQHHTEEMVDLNRVVDSRMELCSFLRNKLQRRIALSAVKKAQLRQQKIEIEIARKRDELAKTLADIQEYEECTDLDNIQEQFLHQAEEAISLFTIMNNVYAESEHIANNIQYLRDKFAHNRLLNVSRTEHQAKMLNVLKTDLQVIVNEVQKYDDLYTAQNATLSSIFRGISDLIQTIKLSPQNVQHLLGQNVLHEGVHKRQSLGVRSASRVIKTIINVDMHNVFCFLVELETCVINAMKNTLLHENTTSSTKQHIVKRCIRQSNSFKIESIQTPCALCIAENQGVLCPMAISTAWSRSSIVNKLDRFSAEYLLMEASLHTISKCKIQRTGLEFTQDS